MIPRSNRLIVRAASPAAALGMAMACGVVLAVLPPRWSDPLRGGAALLLRPGQTAASALRQYARGGITTAECHFQSAARLAALEEELEQLQWEHRRVVAELAAARSQASKQTGSDDQGDRLLLAQCVPARVLGRQARAFLVRHHLLDVGTSSGLQRDDLVVDGPAVIDRGSDAALRTGQLVLSGRRIWGKIVQLGPHTSAVRAATEPGYRDLVFVVGSEEKPNRWQRQGILEGSGEPLCRIRLVEVTEPVAVGDLVYTAAAKGLLPEPLLYGQVVRLDRPAGAAHWEIWMRPAVGPHAPENVAVLRAELNPLRVAETGKGIRD
jgi:cell shape-determining protein MreC